jgi:hypothetical protein
MQQIAKLMPGDCAFGLSRPARFARLVSAAAGFRRLEFRTAEEI